MARVMKKSGKALKKPAAAVKRPAAAAAAAAVSRSSQWRVANHAKTTHRKKTTARYRAKSAAKEGRQFCPRKFEEVAQQAYQANLTAEKSNELSQTAMHVAQVANANSRVATSCSEHAVSVAHEALEIAKDARIMALPDK